MVVGRTLKSLRSFWKTWGVAAFTEVGRVDRDDLDVPAADDAEHVQREDEGVVVVAEVAGVVGVEAGLGRGDLVEVPVRRRPAWSGCCVLETARSKALTWVLKLTSWSPTMNRPICSS